VILEIINALNSYKSINTKICYNLVNLWAKTKWVFLLTQAYSVDVRRLKQLHLLTDSISLTTKK